MHVIFFYFLFFFQAEDGIRDLYVTGVQTCALPICSSSDPSRVGKSDLNVHARYHARKLVPCAAALGWAREKAWRGECRSEERRVGKEWRCRGEAGDVKK